LIAYLKQHPVAVFFILVAIIIIAIPAEPEQDVALFCTYNRVFIEFKQGSATWGTIMLDDNGKPVPCDQDDNLKRLSTKHLTRI
jgi:hypothetical protein